MRIDIANRLRPFSHRPGTRCLIPGSSLVLQVFPMRFRFWNLQGEPQGDLIWNLHGPVDLFTVQLDLEQSCIWIWGKAKEGYVRLRIRSNASGDAVELWTHRLEMDSLSGNWTGKGACSFSLSAKENLCLWGEGESFVPYQVQNFERLSLGCHKSQDWDLVCRRKDIREWLPFVFSLGQQLACPSSSHCPMESLLQADWTALFPVAFRDLLVPQAKDELFQGIVEEELFPEKGCPLLLFQAIKKRLRSLFLEQQDSTLSILPHLPSQLYCGRLVGWCCGEWGEVDVEWSKKQVRRVVFRAEKEGSLQWIFRHIKRFRLREGDSIRQVEVKEGESLFVKKGAILFFDRFQK